MKKLKNNAKGQAMKPRRQPVPAPVEKSPADAPNPPAPAPAGPVDPKVPPSARGTGTPPARGSQPRLSVPDRQLPYAPRIIDDLIDAEHPARAVWAYVEDLDLTVLYDRIRARDLVAGRPAIDPRVLVALWLYGTLSGFTSASELDRMCDHYEPLLWLAGGVSVNAHTLSDFRTDNPSFRDALFQHSVDVLRQRGTIDLDRIAQDGVRVRASAGAGSFHRHETLTRQLREAKAELRALRAERAAKSADPTAPTGVPTADGCADEPKRSPQQQAAVMHQAEDRVDRVEAALERLPEMEAKIEPGSTKEARVSTTDPQATVMKMADGGFRPAYNVEFATTCKDQVIVGVDVVTVGSDQGQLPPMLDQIQTRVGHRPKEVLVDGGYVNLKDITAVQAEGTCTVYAPVPQPKNETVDRYKPKPTDSPEVAEWRARMGTDEAKEIYKQRAATAECVNAQARNRGLSQFRVRGLDKVKAVATWLATAHNMARYFALKPKPVILAYP
jgi:transposase